MENRPEMIDAYRRLLTWFAKRHPRGSQTNHWERWLSRAVDETVELGLPVNITQEALSYLRERGLIETNEGTGSFTGAKVTTITERGYRYLDRLNGESFYDADILAAAVQALIAALHQSSTANTEQVAKLQDIVEELHSRRPLHNR